MCRGECVRACVCERASPEGTEENEDLLNGEIQKNETASNAYVKELSEISASLGLICIKLKVLESFFFH